MTTLPARGGSTWLASWAGRGLRRLAGLPDRFGHLGVLLPVRDPDGLQTPVGAGDPDALQPPRTGSKTREIHERLHPLRLTDSVLNGNDHLKRFRAPQF